MDNTAKAGAVVVFVGLALMVIILAIGLNSCGAFEPSDYEYLCDFPGCDRHAEYSVDGHKYCPEHYRILYAEIIY